VTLPLGFKLIQIFVSQLNGEADILPENRTTVCISFPLRQESEVKGKHINAPPGNCGGYLSCFSAGHASFFTFKKL
jgi:hypothetical protein